MFNFFPGHEPSQTCDTDLCYPNSFVKCPFFELSKNSQERDLVIRCRFHCSQAVWRDGKEHGSEMWLQRPLGRQGLRHGNMMENHGAWG